MSNLDLGLAESVSTTDAPYFILVYLLVLLYCCFGLAVVCDVYFVPALQKLSHTYNLPPDIAGSTLMALGASVPELFASLIGVFVTEDDIGTGSIIGSSCFNLIAVPAACAFVASASFSRKLEINSGPVIRNSAFYAITILVLLLIIKDNKVDILEAIILLLFFVMYMAYMIFSVQVKDLADSLTNSFASSYISKDSAIAGCCNVAHDKHAYYTSQANNNNNATNRTSAVTCNSNNNNIIIGNSISNNLNKTSNTHANGGQLTFTAEDTYGGGHTFKSLANSGYAQFYFADPDHNNNNNNNHARAADERTPLVSGAFLSNGAAQSHNNAPDIHLNMTKSQQIHPTLQARDNMLAHDSCISRLDSDSCRLNLAMPVKNSACLHQHDHFCSHSFGLDGALPLKACPEHEDNWVSSKWILLPLLPLTLSMKILTPCKFKTTCTTIWTFLVSILLIGGLTYVSVWMVHLFGQRIGVPETVAGMTILSWGTGIPELIASIVLIKKTAQADMAICNTIGSNVIDVSFCLSLPWIVKCVMFKADGAKPEVEIQSAALPWTTFLLLLALMLLILVLKLNNWQLCFNVGFWLAVIYIGFVIVATYLEYTFSKSGIDFMALF